MPIQRKTSADYANDLANSITSRNTEYDTQVGPIPDLVINPLAGVLELQNERTRAVQSLLSLINNGSWQDADLNNFVYNELMLRSSGSRATTTLVFARSTPPTVDTTVKTNFPVSTLADEQTATSFTFITLADATMVAANAPSYFNPSTQKYELHVPAMSIASNSLTNVGPNRIIKPLRPLSGFETVTNPDAAINGADTESNTQLIERYFLSLMGSSPAVVRGITKTLRALYSNVLDSNIVYGNNVLNTRAAADAGATDVYFIGSIPSAKTENFTFPGANQVIPFTYQPVINITNISGYVQGTDYILVRDTSGYAGSVRGSDGVKWLTTATTTPAVGAVITVSYTYNVLNTTLQNEFTAEQNQVIARDILYKSATQVDTTLSANIKILAGYNQTTILGLISTAILNLFSNYKLGMNVEGSDIQAVVRSFTSVDNFVITNLSRVGAAVSITDMVIGANEFARMAPTDLILTPV